MGGKVMRHKIKKVTVILSLISVLVTSLTTISEENIVNAEANVDCMDNSPLFQENEEEVSNNIKDEISLQDQTTSEEDTTEENIDPVSESSEKETTETTETTEASEATTALADATTEAVSSATIEDKLTTETHVETSISVTAASEEEIGGIKSDNEEMTENSDNNYTKIQIEQEFDNRVEQIKAKLPTIWTIFYYDGEYGELKSDNPQNIRMMFNGYEWQADKLIQWKETEYGIHYYVLLDTSASVKEYFEELTDAINELVMKMEEHDTLTIYTVGNEQDTLTPVISEATVKDSVQIKEILDTLSANDERTYLNNAIAGLVKEIQKKNKSSIEDFDGRDIILILSDGANDSNTGKTSEEVKNLLKDSNIPVYAFMNKNVQSTNGNALEGISASSGGGSIYVENNDFSHSVNNQVENFQDAWIATFSGTDARENVAYIIDLCLIVNDNKAVWYASKNSTFYRTMPDEEAPQVVDVKLAGDNCVDVTFSEFVIGAEVKNAYEIEKIERATSDSGEIGQTNSKIQVVDVVEIGNHTDYTYRLTLNEVIYRGDYRLCFNNITDLHGNPLTPTYFETTFENAPEEDVEKESFFKQYWWIFLVVFLLVLVMILLIVFHVIKKNKGIVIVDDKAVLAGNTDVKQHIVLEQQKDGQPILLYLHSEGRMIKKVDARVQGSIIVGRSDLCDVFIDDVMMSRQHFAIEFDGESFYIQDLDTTNGTMLNGVKITHKRRLEKNDRITAGSLDIVVRW